VHQALNLGITVYLLTVCHLCNIPAGFPAIWCEDSISMGWEGEQSLLGATLKPEWLIVLVTPHPGLFYRKGRKMSLLYFTLRN